MIEAFVRRSECVPYSSSRKAIAATHSLTSRAPFVRQSVQNGGAHYAAPIVTDLQPDGLHHTTKGSRRYAAELLEGRDKSDKARVTQE